MDMKKFIFLIITIVITYPALTNGAVAVPALDMNTPDIANQKDCEVLGGNWNTCPPNDCQQSADYQDGQAVCPQVCGAPICQGLLPVEPVDLSNIHNESIGHQSLPLDDNLDDSQSPSEPPIKISPPPAGSNEIQNKSAVANQPSLELDIFNFRDFLPAIFIFILGIILILLGVALFKKKRTK